MMEAPKGQEKFSCKVCEKKFPSGPLSGHMKWHSGDLKRKTKSAYGNEEPEDLILAPESEVELEIALALIDLEKSGSRKKELLEIHIPESEAACKSLFLEMWPNDREKIQVTDSAPEEKEKIEKAAKQGFETDVSLTDLKRTVYECNTCYRTFGSYQALGGHLAGWTRGRTCLQEQDIKSMAVVARFNCDGYKLEADVVWAKRR